MKTGISKKQSLLLYGIAIIFMVYHHTFCIPSRLQYEYFSVLGFRINFLNNSLETIIAWFCKICVAIFAFLTGYGFSKKLDFKDNNPFKKIGRSYLIVFKKILSLIFKLLLVLSVFVPLYYFVNNRSVPFEEFISNLFGLSSSLNGEWWYINFYFGVCLLLPLLDQIFFKGYKNKYVQIIFIVICSSLIVLWFVFGKFYVPNIKYFIIVLEGYFVSRFKIFEFLSSKIAKSNSKTLSIILLASCIFSRIILSIDAGDMDVDIYIIMPFVYSVINLIPEESNFSKGLCFFGKFSTFIWLTHTFFEYYIFPRFITISGISTLIFIEILVISLLFSIGLMYLEKILISSCKYVFKKIIKVNKKYKC